VKPDNIHLTLKFLGDINENQLKQISEGLTAIAINTESFKLGIGKIGAFPRINNPKTVWVGVEQNSLLIDLFEQLEEIASNSGIPKEKRSFSPHLTVGRVKFLSKENRFTSILTELEFEEEIIPVNSVSFIESRLTPEGPVYSVIHKYPLIA
jgi:2'-5' RNA ligase